MVSIRRALFLACLPVITGPLVLFWAWPQSRMFEHVLTVLAVGLLLAALVAVRAGIIISSPLAKLNDTARLMAQGNFDVRVETGGRWTPQEIKFLSETFNDMAARLNELSSRGIELRRRAEQSSESKSEFMRTITHELRSPLNAMIGFSDLLMARSSSNLSPEVRAEYLADINAGAHHLLSLVNDFLDLARAESGQYDLIEDAFWLDEITRRATRYVEALASERQINVGVHFDGNPPIIRGDERALFQALLNLVTNAVRYGRRGGSVIINVRSLETTGIEIVVADDGPGIAPDDLARVMLPFQRATNKGAENTLGTGLGLPIVKQFIELHGGTFQLSSIVGIGTRARIALPGSRICLSMPGSDKALVADGICRAA